MSQGLPGIIELLITPPGLSLWLLALGLWFMQRCKSLAYGFLGTGVGSLFLASLPIVPAVLMGLLESYPPLDDVALEKHEAQAIVILGGGRRDHAPEYGGTTLKPLSLERVRYGAWLAKKTGLPILVSGGLGDKDIPAEATIMKSVLEKEFGQEVKWVEDASRNTFENAKFSQAILTANHIKTVYVVSHAWDQARALWSFRQVGLNPIPAPTAFESWSGEGVDIYDFLPSAKALLKTAYATHEILGNIWYRIRY
jgi:uncharacterized SAM-binding protein YcdF (DUF218 family)